MRNSDEEFEDAKRLSILKDNFRVNTTQIDDDLAIDIQDAIDRDPSLSLVANNMLVTVEREVVTLTGEVYREQERAAVGNIATTLAGDDNVNNYLRVINSFN